EDHRLQRTVGRHGFERGLAPDDVDVIADGDEFLRDAGALIAMVENHQSIRLDVAERPQEHGLDDGEDGDVGTDAERQGQNRRCGERGLPQKPTERVTEMIQSARDTLTWLRLLRQKRHRWIPWLRDWQLWSKAPSREWQDRSHHLRPVPGVRAPAAVVGELRRVQLLEIIQQPDAVIALGDEAQQDASSAWSSAAHRRMPAGRRVTPSSIRAMESVVSRRARNPAAVS